MNNEKSDIGRILGIILLILAGLGVYWVADAVFQLWNTPKSVPFVSLFIDLLQENQKPIMKSSNGAEINLPDSWPVAIGIFFSIVLISSIGLLVRSFLTIGLSLLFSESISKKEKIDGMVDIATKEND
ncbi:MAG: hypothetical protein KZQ96_23595 [Candidatus Thiodiazotropha sp. (ex Lucinoma borealis)]|nr:hypothetical protein [Candidatus Thiodiazotropha sp. (ex Lucinoma borealis)]